MKTQQTLLESRGMAIRKREGKAPRVIPKGCLVMPQPVPAGNSRQSLGGQVMAREARQKQLDRDYQDALIYEDEDFRDNHPWRSRQVPKETPLAPKRSLECVRKLRESHLKRKALSVQKLRQEIVRGSISSSVESPSLKRSHARAIYAIIKKDLEQS
jgi:hypothetical protein